MSRALLVTIVLTAVFAGFHYYFWRRLVHDTSLPPRWRRGATVVVVVLGTFLPLAMIGLRLGSHELKTWLAYPAYGWMGACFLLFLVLVVLDLAFLVVSLARRASGRGPTDPSRRVFIARGLGAAGGLATTGVSALAVREALAAPALERLEVTLARLPPALDGFKIVQLTDVHVGPTIGRPFMEELVARVNALAPDLVAVTGDLVDGSVTDLGAAIAPLRELRARHGVYFVTGNHEYFSGADDWIAFLATLGVRTLRNERLEIGAGEDSFDLAGVDDWSASGPGHGRDLARALAGRDERRALVLLAHQPRQVHEAARAGVDLQLSGHTHGGQLWPFKFLQYLEQPFVAGLARAGATWIYVSRGTGYWGPPMRLASPSEITEITLRAGEARGREQG